MLKKCTSALLFLTVSAVAVPEWSIGLKEGGGGLIVTSPDQTFSLGLQGYSQFSGNVYFADYKGSPSRPEAPFGFGVRRARLDFVATLFRNYELLTELGTPTLRIPGAVTGTDLSIIETRLTMPVYRDVIHLRAGKFVTPFSGENARSSRRLDTVERSTLLTSLIAAGLLDSQMGAMVFGRMAEGVFTYYLGVFNGATNPLNTDGDNNADKEFQVKLVFNPSQGVTFGLAWDTSVDPTATVSLYDHALVPYASGQVSGRHHGFGLDLDITTQAFSLRAEMLGFTFPASGTALINRIRTLWGFYLQAGVFAVGGENGGFEWILRYEFAQMDSSRADDLQSFVTGWNWNFNTAVRYQLNYILEAPSKRTAGVYASARVKHMVLNQLQIKF